MPVVIRTSPIEGQPLPGLGIKKSILLCVLFYVVFVATMVLELIGCFMMLHAGVEAIDMYSLIVLPQLLAWAVTVPIALTCSGMSFREARFKIAFPWQIVPALLVASVGAAILLVEVTLWIPMPEAFRRSIVAGSEHAPFLTMLVPVAIVAPLAEEFFFRGLLLRDYLERYSLNKSVWATAIMFSLFHLNPWQSAVALPLGLWFAWLVLRTGSLIPGVICHAAYNFSTMFVLKPLAMSLGYTADEWQAADHLPAKLLAVGAVLAVGGGALLWRQLAGANAVVIDASGPITSEIDVPITSANSAQQLVGLGEFESGIQDLNSNEVHLQGFGGD